MDNLTKFDIAYEIKGYEIDWMSWSDDKKLLLKVNVIGWSSL